MEKMEKMKEVLEEETILFISVLKWIALATFIGIIVGFSTGLFLKTLVFTVNLTASHRYYFFLLPLALLVSSFLTMLCPGSEGHGTEKVIEAIHRYSGKIRPLVIPVKFLATIVTIAGGGSVGKEGPAAQIGAGLSSLFAGLFRFDERDRKKLVICGISAGFASIFGTPIAGALFGVEVLYVGGILYDVLLPSFIAGMASYHVCLAMGINYFHHSLGVIPVFSGSFVIKTVIAGIFFGICARLLIEVMNQLRKLDAIFHWKPLRAVLGGLLLIFLTLAFSNQYLGLGIQTIQRCLEGGEIVWYAFLLKIIFTSLTLNSGGSGGIVTPIFFIGATSGSLFARIFGADPSTFSAIGLVALLAGAGNAPISASVMAVELFGSKIGVYASIASVISFIMTGHASVYPSQVLAMKKSATIDVETGKEVETVHPRLKLRRKSITYLLAKIIKKIL